MANRLDQLIEYIETCLPACVELDGTDAEFVVEVLKKTKDVWRAQRAFFDSKSEGRPGDRALLSTSRKLESELKRLLEQEDGGLFS